MQIREVRADELPALLALYRQLHEQDEAPPSDLAAHWDALRAQPGLTVLGVEVAGQLVASCVLAVIPNLTRGARPFGVIENVVTDAAHRRQGLGQALLAAALERAWAQRCYKVVITTSRKDAATLAFYQRAGFDRHDKTAFVARAPGGRGL